MTRTDYTSSYVPNFAYSQADLEANRQGVLTQDQFYVVESVYQARQRGARQTFILFAIWIPLLMIIGGVIEYNQSNKNLSEFLPAALPSLMMIGGVMMLVLLMVSVFTMIHSRDARDKRISVAEGKARVIERSANARYSRYMRYELVLQKGVLSKQRFRFANHASVANFEAGKTYRLYYIKYYPFPLLLSAEEP